MQLEKVYEPQRFEPHWAQWWIDSGIFHAPAKGVGRVFSLVIPPPNVTGSLHIGHMLEHTEIDVTIRWRRMLGDNTLWLPGTDHAGIATQMVVERKLAEEGISRHDLGREKFVERVWEWKQQYGDTIKRQMIRMGTSCDWSRERFTLDDGLSRAVREVFVRLYEKGLIYRGEYMVNWCPQCRTAISDLEVKHDDTNGHLWHIRYPVKDTGRYIVIATTRPETMLGDAAVAVNPRDERYTWAHGKRVLLPLMNREIPVILDELADPKFGTGAVKVTPAHDPNDFEAGKRHSLPRIKVIDETGHMTSRAGKYGELERFAARKAVIEDLKKLDLLEKIEDHPLSVGKCYRCSSVVEPLISMQWFVKIKPLADKAIAAVESGSIVFVPDNWTKVYYEWMYNIRDWCVSRQLWWGHRIPAWHCQKCQEIIVAREAPEKCACGGAVEQDPDVLDTWFSSALWPFSTLGWPEETEDLRTFYPTSLLVTGFDILFFWVARMIMMGIEFMGEVPFRQVYIHGLVRDAEHQKMSKSRGNTIDPLVITEKYGTDAVRFALLMGAAPGTDIVLTEERMEATRAFANKIWNAARWLFQNMERSKLDPWVPERLEEYRPQASGGSLAVPLEDRWIFSRLNQCAERANRSIEQYRYHEAAQELWEFFWHEFCDWYLELKKLRLMEDSGLTGDWRNLLAAFEAALRLLHPVMPFLTEELWQRLVKESSAGRPASIAISGYPQYNAGFTDLAAEREVQILQDIIKEARILRSELKLDPKERVDGVLYSRSAALEVGRANTEAILRLAGLKLEFRNDTAPTSGAMRSRPEFDLVIQVPTEHVDAHRRRLEKEMEQLEKTVANSNRQLADETFLSRAPAHVVDGLRAKLSDYVTQIQKIRGTLGGLGK